jgi:hypothetical protein
MQETVCFIAVFCNILILSYYHSTGTVLAERLRSKQCCLDVITGLFKNILDSTWISDIMQITFLTVEQMTLLHPER